MYSFIFEIWIKFEMENEVSRLYFLPPRVEELSYTLQREKFYKQEELKT